jgi:hypothetical protein
LGFYVGLLPDKLPSYHVAVHRWALRRAEQSWGSANGGLIGPALKLVSNGGSALQLADAARGVLAPSGAQPGFDYVLQREFSIETCVLDTARRLSARADERVARDGSCSFLFVLDRTAAKTLADELDVFVKRLVWPPPLDKLVQEALDAGKPGASLRASASDGGTAVDRARARRIAADLGAVPRLIGALESPPTGNGVHLFLSVSDGTKPSLHFIVAYWIDLALVEKILAEKDEKGLVALGLAFARRLPMESTRPSHDCLPRVIGITIPEHSQVAGEMNETEFMLRFVLRPLGLMPAMDENEQSDGVRSLSVDDIQGINARLVQLYEMPPAALKSEVLAYWKEHESNARVRGTLEAWRGSAGKKFRKLIQKALVDELQARVAYCGRDFL